jgi:hypothetical protein
MPDLRSGRHNELRAPTGSTFAVTLVALLGDVHSSRASLPAAKRMRGIVIVLVSCAHVNVTNQLFVTNV